MTEHVELLLGQCPHCRQVLVPARARLPARPGDALEHTVRDQPRQKAAIWEAGGFAADTAQELQESVC